MSAPNWLGDPQPYQNGENGSFNGASDPSMAFMHTPTSSNFDFHHMQTQQLQQRMQNGNIANGSLVPHNPNPMYQTQTTIPSKRPRPREDSVGGSPRSYSGTLPVSRSQTPHGTYPGYSVAVNGATFPANNSYAGMQQPVTTASHSPGMPNQNHNPQNPQQRLRTMSPSPFSPAAQTFGNHVSPPHSENGTRVNTPQNSGQQYSNNAPYGMGTGQSFMPPAATSVNGVQPSHFSQNSQHEQMMMDARMRQTAQMGPLRGGGHPQGLSFNSSGQTLNQLSSAQITQMRAQQAQPNQQRPQYMQNMLHNITQFARQRGIHFDPQPLIAFRPVSSIQLFFVVLKLGGSRRISLGQQWPQVATLLGYPPPQSMVAGQELQSYWHSSLADFETYYMQHQQSQQQQRQRALADPTRSAVSFQPSDTAPRQPSFSPAKQMHDPQQARFMQQPSNPNVPYQTPTQHITPTQPGIRHPLPNGYIDPQKARMQVSPPNVYNQQPTMAPNQLRNEILQGHQASAPVSIVRGRREKSKQENPDNPEFWQSRKTALSPMYIPRANNLELKPQRPAGKDDEDADGHAQSQDSAIDETSGSTFPTNHGGFPVTEPGHREGIEALLKFKLRAPLLEELGPIDIRAITLSLRSTINGEVRHALDTIASLSITKSPPSLDQCEDLVEALVDCADDQVEVLAEHAPEVSDAMLITSYEDTVRGCKAEISEMQIYPDFGTLEHHLDKAIDRLICITTILRNFAFSEASHRALTDPIVLKMMTTVIRYLGTRNMMLRTHRNALDFTKDVVVFLSQTAHRLDFQNKDEALCILHFLVSFAPLPEPNDGRDSEVTFSTYSPSLNRYLPHAVDSLAKLLTREPNRSFCRTIFMSDAASTLPYDLLTRAFGLAVGPVPEIGITEPTNTVTYRIPFLVQGLLAAEILIGMIPSSGRHLASSWANSYDGFASRLMRMVAILSRKLPAQPDPQQQRHNGPHGAPPKEAIDHYGYIMVTNRGLAVLRKLIEKAKEADGDIKRLPSGILPNQQNVIAALSAPTMDGDVIRQLCAFSGLDT